jgi:hypothetical protein
MILLNEGRARMHVKGFILEDDQGVRPSFKSSDMTDHGWSKVG